MSTSGIDLKNIAAKGVSVGEDSLVVELSDGRTIAVPVTWFPRLLHGTLAERSNW